MHSRERRDGVVKKIMCACGFFLNRARFTTSTSRRESSHEARSRSRQKTDSGRERWCTALIPSKNSILRCSNFKPPTIQQLLLTNEGIVTSRHGIAKFLKVYKLTGTIDKRRGSGRPSKASEEVRKIVEEQMRNDDETTAIQLHRLLVTKGHGISLSTILRCRKSLGWTYRGSAYCQLIRDANKEKRLAWARENLHNDFNDVIWNDETTVQLESHRRFACRKRGEPPRPKPR